MTSPAAANPQSVRSGLRLSVCVALAATLLTSTAPLTAQDLSALGARIERVAPDFHVIAGHGGNVGVLSGADGVMLVDAQFGPIAPKIDEAVKMISPAPVRLLINTHWHFDHVGGNERLGSLGTVIATHDKARARMSSRQSMPLFGQSFEPSPAAAVPTVTFDRNASFHFNGETVRALHVPNAHTDGDTIVHLPRHNIVMMGDVFYNGVYPYIDVDTGGSVQGYLAAIDTALALIDDRTVIVPGHGPLARRADLVAFRDMIREVRRRIEVRIRAGDSLDKILAAKPTADLDAKWGQGFVKGELLVRFIHISLTRPAA